MFKIPPLQAHTFAFFVITWGVDLGLQYKRSIFHSQAGLFKWLDALMSSVWLSGHPALSGDDVGFLVFASWQVTVIFVNYQVKGLVTR